MPGSGSDRVDTQVYEPAEDSSLLADAVLDHVDASDLVLDVGTGSGYVGVTVHERTGATVVGTDLNPHACRKASEAGLPVVRGDLLGPFRGDVADVVMFNPPYLPRDPDMSWDDWFEVAVTGGETGRETIERFLDDLGRVLGPDGVAFLLVSTLTGVDAVVEHADCHGFAAVAIQDVSFPGETLTVLKLVR